MGLLIGPVVALLGVLAAYAILRTRARERQSLYSARRTLLEERAQERRDRALAPPAPDPAPAPPAEAVAATTERPLPTQQMPAWDRSPVPPPAAPAVPSVEPAAAAPLEPAAPPAEVPSGWEPQPNPALGSAAAPTFESAAPVAPPAEPAPLAAPPASSEPALPSEPEPAPEPAPAEAQPTWSIVEAGGKERPMSAATSDSRASWELPARERRTRTGGARRGLALVGGVIGYLGLVGSLLVVLLGILLMLATSK